MTKQIDLKQIELVGLHGMRINGQLAQMLFAGPDAAILFAQRLLPTRDSDVIEIVPVVIVERRKSEKDPKDDRPTNSARRRKPQAIARLRPR
jgi:hypothetical protein